MFGAIWGLLHYVSLEGLNQWFILPFFYILLPWQFGQLPVFEKKWGCPFLAGWFTSGKSWKIYPSTNGWLVGTLAEVPSVPRIWLRSRRNGCHSHCPNSIGSWHSKSLKTHGVSMARFPLELGYCVRKWGRSWNNKFFTGWWFEPLWKILVNWDDYSQYMGK